MSRGFCLAAACAFIILPGCAPSDSSVIYEKAHVTGSGATLKNGKAFDKCNLHLEKNVRLVVPDKETLVERHDNEHVVEIYMMKRIQFGSQQKESADMVAQMRPKMGCAVKRVNEELFIGTFGEFSFREGVCEIRLVIFVPAKVDVNQRDGLIGSPRGPDGKTRSPSALNPFPQDLKAALAKTKEGSPNSFLPPDEDDGWHEIPAVADAERRASK